MIVSWITGAHGFVGRHLSSYLNKQGHLIAGLGHGAWPRDEARDYGVNYWINGDISQPNLDQLATNAGKPDFIFHLAGGSSVYFSLQTPEEDFRRTVDSTIQLLEWIRLHSPDTIIVTSSSAAVYGDGHSGLITENAPTNPFSPYGYHKRIMELALESYSNNFGLTSVIVRLFSVYGPGLCKQLIWDLCCRLKNNPEKLTLAGTGFELRDWLHIEDAVTLLHKVAEHSRNIKRNYWIINGATGCPVSVRDIAAQVCASWKSNAELSFNGLSRIGDPQSLVADISLLNSIGFSCSHHWKTGISDYVHWFKDHRR